MTDWNQITHDRQIPALRPEPQPPQTNPISHQGQRAAGADLSCQSAKGGVQLEQVTSQN